MKAIAIAALTGIALFTAWGQDANGPFAQEAGKGQRHRLAQDFDSCPDGHKTLKDIPIVFGRGPWDKRPGDYAGKVRKLKGQHDRGEIYFGGDVRGEDSPKFKVRCQTCGYFFNESVIVVDGTMKDQSDWSRASANPNQFKVAFTKRLLGVPQIDVVDGSLKYLQAVDADGGKVRWEQVTYYSTAAPADIVVKVRKWMDEQKLDSAALKPGENGDYTFVGETVSLLIADDPFWNPGKIRVSFSERRVHPMPGEAPTKKEIGSAR